MSLASPLHAVAVAVAIDADGPLAGLLILGAPGRGKSTLALELIDSCPWRRTALIADDAVMLTRAGDALVARSPGRLEGQIEIRGFGVVSVQRASPAIVRLVLDLDILPERFATMERFAAGDGGEAPSCGFDAAQPAAAARVRAILRAILGGQS